MLQESTDPEQAYRYAQAAKQLAVQWDCSTEVQDSYGSIPGFPLEGAIGPYVFRETFPFFMLSRFTDRAFTKPRGLEHLLGAIV